MTKEQWVGIGCLVFGIAFLWWTIKYPTKKPDMLTANFKGYIVGISSIVGGIMFLIGKLHF